MLRIKKLFRVSKLASHQIEEKTTNKIIDYLEKNSKSFDGIVISDFVYGVITPKLLEYLRYIANREKIFLFGDLNAVVKLGISQK